MQNLDEQLTLLRVEMELYKRKADFVFDQRTARKETKNCEKVLKLLLRELEKIL